VRQSELDLQLRCRSNTPVVNAQEDKKQVTLSIKISAMLLQSNWEDNKNVHFTK
jgi:hypothetical protein